MDKDQWDAFKQHEAQLRQSRIEKEQRLSEEKERKKKEVENQQIAREKERRELEQRQSELRQIAESKSEERRLHDEATRSALFSQSTEDLRIADQRRREAQQTALLKIQEVQRSISSGSPIEATFYEVWCATYPDLILKRQHPIGRYRVDFAHLESMTVIELDGHEFHSTRKARTRDYQRQRQIEDQGWFFVRFTGSEVFHDAVSCIAIAHRRISERMAR